MQTMHYRVPSKLEGGRSRSERARWKAIFHRFQIRNVGWPSCPRLRPLRMRRGTTDGVNLLPDWNIAGITKIEEDGALRFMKRVVSFESPSLKWICVTSNWRIPPLHSLCLSFCLRYLSGSNLRGEQNPTKFRAGRDSSNSWNWTRQHLPLPSSPPLGFNYEWATSMHRIYVHVCCPLSCSCISWVPHCVAGWGQILKNKAVTTYTSNNFLVPGAGNKCDPERENWPCRVMLPILPIQSISGSRLLPSPGITLHWWTRFHIDSAYHLFSRYWSWIGNQQIKLNCHVALSNLYISCKQAVLW